MGGSLSVLLRGGWTWDGPVSGGSWEAAAVVQSSRADLPEPLEVLFYPSCCVPSGSGSTEYLRTFTGVVK